MGKQRKTRPARRSAGKSAKGSRSRSAPAGVMVGIIGGTGLGEALGAVGRGKRHDIDTPFGRPSGPITVTEVDGVPVALLARHGAGHLLNPSAVPYRANIYALKLLGVTHILAGSAVGSLREELRPRELVIPDQVIDRTFRRAGTFFDRLAVHVEFARPFCPTLRQVLLETAAAGVKAKVHGGGTYVCMEGPQFSTRAESHLHRSWGADLIGMTLMPEAKLAREAEICYAAVNLPTDYDCWKPHEGGVNLIAEILGNLKEATAHALELIRAAIPRVVEAAAAPCACRSALKLGLWSDRKDIPAAVRKQVGLLIGKYLR
jgi:5'-methylthioadenosine phosphorylase